jgi:hypothetical protein
MTKVVSGAILKSQKDLDLRIPTFREFSGTYINSPPKVVALKFSGLKTEVILILSLRCFDLPRLRNRKANSNPLFPIYLHQKHLILSTTERLTNDSFDQKDSEKTDRIMSKIGNHSSGPES